MKYKFNCIICNKEKQRYLKNDCTNFPKYCSNKCKGEDLKILLLGKNNPNHNKKWSESKKLEQSNLIKSKVDETYRFNAGKANRGKKFSNELVKKMHHENRSYKGGSSLTEYSKLQIGIKSRQKFTKEYKQNHRKLMEEKGKWVSLENKTDWEIYKIKSNFDFGFKYITEEETKLINSYGIFNTKTNRKGLVRDHILSKFNGFKYLIFPEILKHPVNCKIIFHSENSKKCHTDKHIIPDIEKLLYDIENYNGDYENHDIALHYVKLYRNGKRWTRKEAV